MSDLKKIVAFLKHRAGSLGDWALAYEFSVYSSDDKAECKKRAEILQAQSQVLADLANEIERATILETEPPAEGVPRYDRRRVALSEMTGPMDAVVIEDASIEVVHGHAVEDHNALLERGEGHVQSSWAYVPLAEAPAAGALLPYLDLRYALITYRDGGFQTWIHNSWIEAEAAEEEWSERYNAGVVDRNNSIALCSVTPILIPRRGAGRR